MADVNTNTATQTQAQGNGTQTDTTANANTTGAGADNTPKVKTEEEIRAELQKEYEKMADKRVTDAIKKKEKEWADKQAKEKMTEDERRQAEEQERLQAQAKRDLDLTIKGLKLDVVDAVQEMGLDAGFRNLIAVEDLATITDEDERKATDKIEVGEKQYTEAEYCSRIAGLLAGLDLRVSATYKPLTEVTAIPLVDSDEEVDTAIDAGKLTLYNDGERVVIARGVNSLTTVTEVETADLQKIKINAIQDQIEGDIYSTINKSYIGNYSNSYDNKCLLITAIKGYLRGLEATEGGKGWLKADSSTMEINVAKQKQYLESIGVDTSEMDEQAIKEANTGSHVFLKGTISILDAIEDVDIFINKD